MSNQNEMHKYTELDYAAATNEVAYQQLVRLKAEHFELLVIALKYCPTDNIREWQQLLEIGSHQPSDSEVKFNHHLTTR